MIIKNTTAKYTFMLALIKHPLNRNLNHNLKL